MHLDIFFGLEVGLTAALVISGVAISVITYIKIFKKNTASKEKLNFTTEITSNWGHTTFFLNNFSFDYYAEAEQILRTQTKFEIKWQLQSEIIASFEQHEGLDMIFRKFTYKGSDLLLYYAYPDLYILPKAKESATEKDNERVIEIANYLVSMLHKKYH